MAEYQELIIEGTAHYCRPWENQRGSTYGPTDRDEYEVTIAGMSEDTLNAVTKAGRNPSVAGRGSSKHTAGITEYYKVTSKFKIPMVDAQLNPIEEGTLIANGSTIRVAVEVREIQAEYQKGNTHKLYAKGVQLVKMADMPDDDFEPDAKKASPFGAVEGGYVADTPTTPEETPFTTEEPLDDSLPF